PEKVYNYLKSIGIYYHQYIPCVEFDGNGNPLPYTITGEQWGVFLNGLFECWIGSDTSVVSIRDFDAMLHHLVHGGYAMCVQGGCCDHYLVVEYNGDMYPCDFFVEKSTRLGNVARDGWEKVRASARYHSFAALKSEWNNRCSTCEFLRFCSGDCLKQRYRGESRDSRNVSWLCDGWKAFYTRALPAFEDLAVDYLNRRQMELPVALRRQVRNLPPLKIGWNDPCFCGSGRKYRLCHGISVSDRAAR
ncbi:MAG: SPASM domain-containing protein, partial [Spirochaetales bacterium]|nr:SPASM domain-containing protein [Spirochaetales bacterium]